MRSRRTVCFFPGILLYSMQVQSITSTGKDSQTAKSAFYEFFSALWDKIFVQTSWYPHLMYKIFRYQKLSETPKGPATKIFGSVGQKNWIFICETPLPSGLLKFFHPKHVQRPFWAALSLLVLKITSSTTKLIDRSHLSTRIANSAFSQAYFPKLHSFG